MLAVSILLVCVFAVVNCKVPSVEEIARQQNARIISYANLLSRSASIPSSILSAEECSPDTTSCSDNQLTICGIGNVRYTFKCSDLFDGRGGYCDCEGTQCVKENPVCHSADSMTCSQPGEKWPDASDCRQFVYCDEERKKNLLRCPLEMVYNPNTKTCESSRICQRLSCNKRKLLEWIPFPQAPQYYLFCMSGVGEVRKCAQEGYTMQNNKCQFYCQKEGLFKDPGYENCSKGMWHTCKKRGLSYRKETNYCPMVGETQKYFDEVEGVCKTVKNCGSDPNSESPNENENKPDDNSTDSE